MSAAEQKAQQLLSTATAVGQRGVDQANAALQRAQQYWQNAIALAEKAVTDALAKLTKLLAEHPQPHLQSYSPVRPPVNGARHLFGFFSSISHGFSSAEDAVANAAKKAAEEAKKIAEEAAALAKKLAQEAVSCLARKLYSLAGV